MVTKKQIRQNTVTMTELVKLKMKNASMRGIPAIHIWMGLLSWWGSLR